MTGILSDEMSAAPVKYHIPDVERWERREKYIIARVRVWAGPGTGASTQVQYFWHLFSP
jgi:hypothetical protein